ncbi:hypothetical protein N781_08695 [Pontibacillus halophilus JSM 076056 = DSM 19796]|uniref:Uncharacterized protein n=1 Tax=Pontibacillus halophilus JSM 076056 = DSM 19796 TaxID=1385510 RepID=A0A0A5GFT9_9BACI|nr:hypothetical protein N781_08695 [Pontibacillus halophilus JSM 076056 = DSM 19796]
MHGERRELKQNAAPIQFIKVMFFVVVVSPGAFWLLREEPSAKRLERPQGANTQVFFEEKVTNSTNTGILRGQ